MDACLELHAQLWYNQKKTKEKTMIKLLALDMDGTLLNEDKKIPQENIKAIHAAIDAGVKLVLCTGRPLVGVKPYFKELGLDAENEYLIVNNGATIHQSKDWSIIDYRSLSKEDLYTLRKTVENSPVQLTVFDQDHYIVIDQEPSSLVIRDAGYVFTSPITMTLEEAIKSPVPLFQAMFLADPDQLDQFENEHGVRLAQDFSCVRSQPVIFEAMPPGTTKASALKDLAEKLEISRDQIMAMGDGNNDLEMLEFAGLGVAMGNASDTVKEKANAVTLSNDQAGVAAAIYKYILEA